MEISTAEIAVLSNISASTEASQVTELTMLQLAVVGGGIAELVGA